MNAQSSETVELSVIVPAFNEAGNLAVCVDEICTKLAPLGVTYEILIVDDGSSDETWMVAERLDLGTDAIHRFRHEQNLGMGAAVRTGMAQAKGQWVIMVPGDNQFDVDWPRMLALRTQVDIVVGVREGGYTTWSRRLPSWLYSTGMQILFGLKVRGEVNLYRRDLVATIQPRSSGFFGNTELLIRTVRTGARLASCPLRIRPRKAGRSTGRDPRRMMQVLWETTKLRWFLTCEAFSKKR